MAVTLLDILANAAKRKQEAAETKQRERDRAQRDRENSRVNALIRKTSAAADIAVTIPIDWRNFRRIAQFEEQRCLCCGTITTAFLQMFQEQWAMVHGRPARRLLATETATPPGIVVSRDITSRDIPACIHCLPNIGKDNVLVTPPLGLEN